MEDGYSSEEEPESGGHDFVFVDELSPGQTCPICLVAMCNPVQTVVAIAFVKAVYRGHSGVVYYMFVPAHKWSTVLFNA